MSLFNHYADPITLHSGEQSNWLIDCDALTDHAVAVIARRLAELVGPFSTVEGIPQGGLRLAEAMKTHYAVGEGGHLIVDDVWTTGGSMREAREKAKYALQGAPVYGAVMFRRGKVPLPYWVVAFATVDI